MQLARALGYASPRRMLAEMTPGELGEWIADYFISPWGEWRADWRAAQHTAIYAEVHRNRASRSTPFAPGDFILDDIVAKQDKAARDLDLGKRLRAALRGRNHGGKSRKS